MGCYRIVMGIKVRYREQSSQNTCMHDLWMWTTVWGLPEGVVGRGSVEGGKGGKSGATVIA